MTCIAAFRVGNKGCIMGADRRASSPGVGSWYGEVGDPKVHTRTVGDTKILYATRGGVPFGSIMDCIDWPEIGDMEIRDYITRKVLPLIRKGMEDVKYDPKNHHYSGVLVCIGREIVEIDHSLGMVFHRSNFVATGDGSHAAYGAFDMRESLTGRTKGTEAGITAIRHVLRIVAKRNWSCDDNIDIFTNF